MPLLLFLALLGSAAPQPSAAELLRRGEQQLADLEYEAAAEDLMRAASAPDATPAERLQANLKAGIANRVLGRDVDARLNFRAVLLADPAARLPPGTPPKVASFFESVRQEVQLEAERTSKREALRADPVRKSLSPTTHALIAAGVTTGVGIITLPLCGYCGGGLCLLCPGTLIAGAGALGGTLIGVAIGGDSVLDNWLVVTAATASAILVTGLLGGAVWIVASSLSPDSSPFTLGNNNLSALGNAVGLGGGFAAALLSGTAAGALTWVLRGQETAAPDVSPGSAPAPAPRPAATPQPGPERGPDPVIPPPPPPLAMVF